MGYERGEELGHGSFGYALKVRRRQDGRTYGATKCRALTASRAQCLTRCGRIQWLHRQRTSPDKVENARQQWIALSLQEGNLEWARALGWDGDPSFGASPDAAVAPAAACPAAAAPNSMVMGDSPAVGQLPQRVEPVHYDRRRGLRDQRR